MKRLALVLLVVGFGCSGPSSSKKEIKEIKLGGVSSDAYPKYLSEWGLFDELQKLSPVRNVYPYKVNAALFSDYAHKARFVKIPQGKAMTYDSVETFQFPDSSMLVKNFYYPLDMNQPKDDRRIIETRLLFKENDAWKALVYKWNDEQTEAERLVLGEEVPVQWKDERGELQAINYTIPSQPQCKSCHDFGGELKPIGPTARNLSKNDYLVKWHEEGVLEGLPEDETGMSLVDYMDKSNNLSLRARSWLEINCAHCHRKEGPAKNTGLYLLASETEPYRIGINKPPVAAGRGSGGHKFSIVPGNPDASILVHRIESLELGEMMPELGRKLEHTEGVELIRSWIASMD